MRENRKNRIGNVRRLVVALMALFCLPGMSFAGKMVVYSAVYPPYQIDDHGKHTGVNTEIVAAIFHHAGIPFEIQYVPWSRAQKIVGEDSVENTAIYSLARNEQREQQYQWVGAYFHQKVGFLALKGSGVRITDLEDVRKYVIGLVRGDSMTEHLMAQGYVGGHEIVNDDILNVRKLYKKRVQTIVTSLPAAKYMAAESGLDPDLLESQYEAATIDFNLALSKKTSDEMLLKLQNSLKTLLENGTIKKIVKKWRASFM